jgi:hypothetical protein
MANSVRAETVAAVRDAVPFLAITGVWLVIVIAVYGLFLVTKPTNVEYGSWVHASVFLLPGIGFLGHVLQQATRNVRAE